MSNKTYLEAKLIADTARDEVRDAISAQNASGDYSWEGSGKRIAEADAARQRAESDERAAKAREELEATA